MNNKYLLAVGLLAVLAVAFGVFGTIAPPLAEEALPVQPQQEPPSEPIGHFQNPPSYDSLWVDISSKPGQYFTLKHNLNTTDVVVDISGRMSLDPMSGDLAWSKAYGGTSVDLAFSMVQTSDGGYALAGCTRSYGAGSYDFWLVRTDSAGNALWNQSYGGIDDDWALSVIQTDDGGYALTGYTWSYDIGNGDFWLVRTDSAGNALWNQSYGGTGFDIAYSIVQMGDGGYALAGYTGSYGAGGLDFWLVRTDSIGNALWTRTYGGPEDDAACSLVQAIDGGYALGGYTNSTGAGGYDFWLVKTDVDGITQWSQAYGGAGDEIAISLIQSGEGRYTIAGETDSYGAGADDFWLVTTDSDGNMQWTQTYGGTGFDAAHSVVQTGDGGYALAGETWSGGGAGYDFWLIKTDGAGNMQWSRTYGGTDYDVARSMVLSSDGGYAIAGYIFPFGAGWEDAWLVKVKGDMNLEHKKHFGGTNLLSGWSKTYGETGSDEAHSLVQTADGGYAIAGHTTSFGAGSGDFWLVKTDAAGTMLWSRTYGGTGSEVAYSLVQTSDGGYALAGYTQSYGAGGNDFWLVKTDSYGTMLWSRTYGGTGTDEARSLVQTADGGYVIAGYTASFGAGNSDFWLVKTDASGIFQWGITYGGASDDKACSLVQTVDGGYTLAGYTASYGAGNSDFWLVKTDASGIKQWNRTYGGIGTDVALSLVQTGDRGYVIAGYTDSYGAGGLDFWLVKTDSNGYLEWSRTYGGTGNDVACSQVLASDGGYALGGWADSFGSGYYDFWLVKTDLAGNMQWSRTYGGIHSEVAYSLVQTTDGGYTLAGHTYSFGAGNYDFWLVKSDIESGLAQTGLTSNSITLYRGKTDLYWNYVRVRIWVIREPSWIYGDLNMDGIVDARDLYILGRNYGQTFSLLSLTGIIAVAGIQTVKKRKQSKQPSYIS